MEKVIIRFLYLNKLKKFIFILIIFKQNGIFYFLLKIQYYEFLYAYFVFTKM